MKSPELQSSAGIEALNVYGGRTFLDVEGLAAARGLDTARFRNLLMKRKSVALPCEDPVSFAINAARPLVDALPPEERDTIELLVVSTESGIDLGKAMSTYVHHYLGLSRNCRSFEVKHACYGGTAALQTALAFVRSSVSGRSRALVVTTDVARPIPYTYAEPSQGAAAVALLVGPRPRVLHVEDGASGFYGYEVMDSCRPAPDVETGDPDLSLLTYLDCIKHSFAHYQRQVGPVDFQEHFDFLALHTPFGGMVKGAHRTMLRDLKRLPPPEIEADFERRVRPALIFCQEVGNVYSGTVFLALAGVIHGLAGCLPPGARRRVGLFSYGSGCCSEFYSGLVDAGAVESLAPLGIAAGLEGRYELSLPEYDRLIALNRSTMFGTEDLTVDVDALGPLFREHVAGTGTMVLRRISHFHREYEWV